MTQQLLIAQYSEAVALAQGSEQLDNVAISFQEQLFTYISRDAVLANTGIRFEPDVTTIGFRVHAHGKVFYGRYDHVRLVMTRSRDESANSTGITSLAGRFRVFREHELEFQSKQNGTCLYSVVFDKLANVRLGVRNGFTLTIGIDPEATDLTIRSFVIELLESIQASLDTVPA